uniref:Paraneoplastic antigen Ma-like C-terminal domain-containing protein n=1 Tax=Cyprinus carpio carpio TaxID=630221 RepID=A0A9J8BME5_CYPCA
MALTKDPFLQAELANWCKDAGIDETHGLMLLNVPVHTEVAEIEEAMEAVKGLGRVQENMETWMDQARLMITECDCSEKEKRRRIVESLKGPALDIIRAVRFSYPEASALQYLEALESTFGSSESGEDLYFKFRLMRQGTGEALSEFLRRMEKTLSKVVEREGLSLRLVDKVRVEQLIRGAVNSDMMLLQLRLRERKNNPPSFLSLLKEIREAEESEAARHRMSAKAKAIHFHENERASTSVIQELKAEIEELRSQISGGEPKTLSTNNARSSALLFVRPDL